MNKGKKNINSVIRFTDRDFDAINNSLRNYIKKYYPNDYKDFSYSSFGSMFLELVSYIGDVLSFNLDFQANEAFLDTAVLTENIIKHGAFLGYKVNKGYSSSGLVSLYVEIPAKVDGLEIVPDEDYLPLVRAGSEFVSQEGINFILLEDVDFGNVEGLEVRVGNMNETTGDPATFVLKKIGKVVSGIFKQEEFEVGEEQSFLKLYLEDNLATEIVSVIDSEGNKYYEVDSLLQNTIYQSLTYNSMGDNEPSMKLKPYGVGRRFVFRYDNDGKYIMFGNGTIKIGDKEYINKPQNVIVERYGKDYISDYSFDPYRLINSDKMGVAPVNTKITVKYRTNEDKNVNISSGALNSISNLEYKFKDETILDTGLLDDVINSIEVLNEEPIVGDIEDFTNEELRQQIQMNFNTQARGVSLQDYKAMAYNMPSRYGSIKRVNVTANSDYLFANVINMYVISEDQFGNLTPSNIVIKENLSNWLKLMKLINIKINILDAYIVNLGLDYEIIVEGGYDKFDVLLRVNEELGEMFNNKEEIGGDFSVIRIYNLINEISGVADCSRLKVYQKSGGLYSDTRLNIEAMYSEDGRVLKGLENVIYEVKFPKDDIRGSVK